MMLTKKEILPIGSLVRTHLSTERENDFVIIVGHLSLSGSKKIYYDYVCIRYPNGIIDDMFYINHEDIWEIIFRCPDHNGLHEKLADRLFGEYTAYYKYFYSGTRPSPQEYRKELEKEKLKQTNRKKRKFIISIAINTIGIVCAVVTALKTNEWLAVLSAIIFVFSTIMLLILKKLDFL